MENDVSEFLPYLNYTHLSHEEKIQVLQVLYRLVEAQVDMAFGVHPVQLACGSEPENDLHKSKKSLDSKISRISPRYRQAANDDCPAIKKGGRRNASGQ